MGLFSSSKPLVKGAQMETEAFRCSGLCCTIVWRNGSYAALFIDTPNHGGDLPQFTLDEDEIRALAAFLTRVAGDFSPDPK